MMGAQFFVIILTEEYINMKKLNYEQKRTIKEWFISRNIKHDSFFQCTGRESKNH